MKWCASCVLPDTRPNLRIEADGRCNACHAHERKVDIDWSARERAFRDVVRNAKRRSRGYDCVIPVSGGKDSTWQTVKCLEYGLRPLAVTWRPPGRTALGQKNLENLVSLGVDHIDYRINPQVEARFMLKTFERFGSTAIPMHLALFNIPLTVAVRLGIPLVVFGENSAFEYGSVDDTHMGFALDTAWVKRYGVVHGTSAADWVDGELDAGALAAYFGPEQDEIERAGVRAIFLGHYFVWDPQVTCDVATTHGFQSNDAGARTGYYDYADLDDDFISLHHWMKWYKFGFTRTFDNLSLEIRNGRMSRDEALTVIGSRGDETPHGDIAKFCTFASISEAWFHAVAETFRSREIWQRRGDGVWWIPDFLVEGWNWT